MKAVFADTSFFIGLMNPRDALAETAQEQAAQLSRRLVTSWWVMVETANFLRSRENRSLFGELLDRLNRSDQAVIVATSDELLQRVIDLYRNRDDKTWSLTDCTSFVIIQYYNITEALTSDHHFRQAGFMPLP